MAVIKQPGSWGTGALLDVFCFVFFAQVVRSFRARQTHLLTSSCAGVREYGMGRRGGRCSTVEDSCSFIYNCKSARKQMLFYTKEHKEMEVALAWQLKMKFQQRPYRSHSLRHMCDSDHLKSIRRVRWLFGYFSPSPHSGPRSPGCGCAQSFYVLARLAGKPPAPRCCRRHCS